MADTRDIDEVSGVETTGHEWDGIKELNNPLPRWWLGLFILTFIFALGYLVFYPGLGNVAGTLGWTSQKQVQSELDAVIAFLQGRGVPAKADSQEKAQ